MSETKQKKKTLRERIKAGVEKHHQKPKRKRRFVDPEYRRWWKPIREAVKDGLKIRAVVRYLMEKEGAFPGKNLDSVVKNYSRALIRAGVRVACHRCSVCGEEGHNKSTCSENA